ncbi:NYN domain-containing protein [Massilia consociata]|uniref:NYN domain-containing protein n=1 Tax=Massilia consociata TaxID=760117 RepID=A0ABV6FKM5_9BURK
MVTDKRVAILVDCDNANPLVLDYALKCAVECGRVVIKRGFGNHTALTNRWQEALVQMAFTPCLQFQYAPGKNTSDIALALDALETFLDARADSFVLVTSDSDFAYLCRKLRERGAAVHIVGEAKTPAALRNACDSFFEFIPAEPQPKQDQAHSAPAALHVVAAHPVPIAKRQPAFVIEAIRRLAADSGEDVVHLGPLGSQLQKIKPGFSSKQFGYPKLIDMLRAYPSLKLVGQEDGGWTVRLSQKTGGKAA